MNYSNNITAQVVKSNETTAWLLVNRTNGGCASCGQNTSCGISNLAGFFSRKAIILKTPNILSAQKGDTVILSYQDKILLKNAFIAYFLPIISLFIFAGLATILNTKLELHSELLPIAGGLFGLLLMGYFLRFYRTNSIIMKQKILN